MRGLENGSNLICVVTGGSDGIGKELTRLVASTGAEVVIASRNELKGKKARDEINDDLHTKSPVIWKPLDITQSQSIQAFAKDIEESYPEGIHVLVNNAGSMSANFADRQRIWNTNFHGPILLTDVLQPSIIKGSHDMKDRKARVIMVTSDSEKWPTSHLRIQNGQIREEVTPRRRGQFADFILPMSGLITYGQSKRGLLAATYALAEEYKSTQIPITVIACNPGPTPNTGIGESYHDRLGLVYRKKSPVLEIFTQSAKKAAEDILYLIETEEHALNLQSGHYYQRRRRVHTSSQSRDLEFGQQVLQVARRGTHF